MPNPCYYHPAVSSIGNCIQCGTPGCASCLEAIEDKMACKRCSPAIKSKFGSEPVPPPQERALGPANDERRFQNSGPRNYMAMVEPDVLTPAKIAQGSALALVVGVLGAIGVEKIMLYSNHGFAFLYVFLGFMVSMSLRAFTGRDGQALALLAAGILIVCLGISHVVYVTDLMSQASAAGSLGIGLTFPAAFPIVMGNLSFIHWMLVAASIGTCFVVSNQKAR